MSLYEVTGTLTRTINFHVTVEADNEDEARALALYQTREGDADETPEDTDIDEESLNVEFVRDEL
jgi:hypothetical protein